MLEIYDDKSWTHAQLANIAHAGEGEVIFYPSNTPVDPKPSKRRGKR